MLRAPCEHLSLPLLPLAALLCIQAEGNCTTTQCCPPLVQVRVANEYLASRGVDPARGRVVEANFFHYEDAEGGFDMG